MSIEDPRQSAFENIAAAPEFETELSRDLGSSAEHQTEIEVAQAQIETPATDTTGRIQPTPVEEIPSRIAPDQNNTVRLPVTVSIDELRVNGPDLVLVQENGTEITIVNGAARIPTFIIADVELPQQALFAALEGSNINVAAGPDGSFSAQARSDSNGGDFDDNPYGAGPGFLDLVGLLGDTSFGDASRNGEILGIDGVPSIPFPLTVPFLFDEALLADGIVVNERFSGILPFDPGPNAGTITGIAFVGASNIDEEGAGLQTLSGFTSGGLPISIETFPVPTDGSVLNFLALRGVDAAGNAIFTITIDNRATGAFTFELVGKHDHPDAGQNDLADLLRLGFTYTVTDLDGDFAVGNFSIDIQDDAPLRGEEFSATVEDEAVNGGNDENDDALSGAASGNLNIRWGADDANTNSGGNGDRSVAFTNNIVVVSGAFGEALTSLGEPVRFAVVNGVLVGYTGEAAPDAFSVAALPPNVVFYVSVSDNLQGSYTFTLVKPLDHAAVEGENPLSLTFNYTATDSDGDAISGQFTVNVRDDVPIIDAPETGLVDEDFLPDGNSDKVQLPQASAARIEREAKFEQVPAEQEGTRTSGNLNIRWGADNGNALENGGNTSIANDRAVYFTQASIDALVEQGLTSDGLALRYDIRDNGTGLVAFQEGEGAGEGVVFSVTLSDTVTGRFDFTLSGNLDHPTKGTSPAEEDLPIRFDFVARDSDGDTASSSFIVEVNDDSPIFRSNTESVSLDEEDIPALSGNVGDSYAGSGEGDDLSSSDDDGFNPGNGGRAASGNLNISWGADSADARSVVFTSVGLGEGFTNGQPIRVFQQDAEREADLTHKGQTVRTWISPDAMTIIGYVGSVEGNGEPSPSQTVFSAVLDDNGTGSYIFTLFKSLDHAAGGREDDVRIDFGIRTTDSDGDSVTSGFSVTIDDDAPVLSGRKESRIVDEDDISTLRDGFPGGSLGTSPDDGKKDGSYTGNPIGSKTGPAFISGSLANLIKGGADEGVEFTFINEGAARAALTSFGLSSKGVELSYDIQGRTLYAYDNDAGNSGYGEGDRLVFKLTVQKDGSYEFELLDQLDHDKPEAGKNENFGLQGSDLDAIDFGAVIQATDKDGDSITLGGAFEIQIRDDVPEVKSRNTSKTLIIDETAGSQKGDDEVAGPLNLFAAVKANNPVSSMQGPQYAQQKGLVVATGKEGADDDATVTWALKLNGQNGLDSGLKTTDGRSIFLSLEDGLIVGRYDSPNDGNRVTNDEDPAAFALHLSNNGTLSIVQYVAIKHDDREDHDESNDPFKDKGPIQQTLAGKIKAVVTVEDFDGDKAVDEVEVGGRIVFEDDGPRVGENALVQLEDDDLKPHGIEYGPGDDAAPKNTTGALNFDFGADGGSIRLLTDGAPEGFDYHRGQDGSLLIKQGDVTVVTVTVDSATGAYKVVQNAAIKHPSLDGSPDDNTENNVEFTVRYRVTDGDGDSVVGQLKINVDDDSPVIDVDLKKNASIIIDETDGDRAPGEGDPKGGNLGTVTVCANDLFTEKFAFGADGAAATKAKLYALSVSVNGVDSGLVDARTDMKVVLVNENDVIKGRAGSVEGLLVFEVKVNASTGDVTVTQFRAVEHGDAKNANELSEPMLANKLLLTATVTDGDGDSTSDSVDLGSIIRFQDDAPRIGSNKLVVLEDDDLKPNGIDGGHGDDAAPKNARGILSHDFGADGGSIALTGVKLPKDLGFKVASNSGSELVVTQTQGDKDIPVLKVVINSQTGAYEVTQLAAIRHPSMNGQGGDNKENNVDFEIRYTVTDGDGDKAYGKLDITIDDDMPDPKVTVPTGTLAVHDETAGLQENDSDGRFPGTVPNAGGDPIGIARSESAIVNVDPRYGADGPGSISYAIGVPGDSISSGLFTTSGEPITLFEVSPTLVVGRYDGEDNGSSVGPKDPAAFAIHIDPVTGVVTIAQYVALKHPDGGDSHNELLALGKDKLRVTVTVEDADGDKVSERVEIGNKIGFRDDGPSIELRAGDDTHIVLETQERDTTNGIDTSTVAFNEVFSQSAQSGADGVRGLDPLRYRLDLMNGSVSSDLKSNGQDITLYKVDGKIYGSTASGSTDAIKSAAVFSISVDDLGNVTLTQFQKIDHSVPDSSGPYTNDVLVLKDGLVTLTVSQSITDGDGDTASSSAYVDLGGNIRFQDDGPSVSTAAPVVAMVDEDGLLTGNADDNLDGEAEGYEQVLFEGDPGALRSLFNFGADGVHASEAVTLKQFEGSDGSGFKSKGQDVLIKLEGGKLIGYVAEKPDVSDERVVFELEVKADGSYTFKLAGQIDHPTLDDATGDNSENTVRLDLSAYIVGKDGDGDTVALTPGKFVIDIVDDIPVHADKAVCLEIDAPFVIDPVPAKVANIVLVLDTSGSIDDRLSVMQKQVEDLLKEFGDSGAKDVRVHIVEFAGDARAVGTYDLIKDGQLVQVELDEAISDVRALDEVGGTNYEAGMQQALEWIEGVPSKTINVTSKLKEFDANANGRGEGNTDMAFIIGHGSTQIALVSGWVAPANQAGHLRSADGHVVNGWGVNGDGRGNVSHDLEPNSPHEVLRFDFGTFNDFDNGGAYENRGGFNGIPVTSATFNLDHEANSGSTNFEYKAYFVDGSEPQTATLSVRGDNAPLTIVGLDGNAGKQIAYIEFRVTSGRGDVDLDSVETAPVPPGTIPNADINKLIFISDGEPNMTNDNDDVSANEAISAIGNEVTAIETAGNRGQLDQKFTIEAFGIKVGLDGLKILDRVEGEGGQATEIKGSDTLTDVMSDLINELGGTTGQPPREVSKTFDLADLVKVGADKDLAFDFKAGTSGSQVTLAGIAMIYTTAGNLLTATAAGNKVFELEIERDGHGTFTLYRPLGSEDVSIDFSSIIEAKDADGDSITLAANQFVVKIDAPDAPFANDDRIITNVGLNSEFSIPKWVLLANDEAEASLDITALTGRQGLGARLGSGDQGIRVTDRGEDGGNFDYTITDGRQSATGSVTVQQVEALRGGSGDDIILARSSVTPTAQTTTIKFAPSYDKGDVVSITVDGVTYTHVVKENGRTAEQVYDALKGEKVQRIRLEESLASKGVRWAKDLVNGEVILTGGPGKANAFELSAEIDNSNDSAKPWITSVDFTDDGHWMSDGDSLSLIINGRAYTAQEALGKHQTEDQYFDSAANKLLEIVNGLPGVNVEFDSAKNTILVKTDFPAEVDAKTSNHWGYWPVEVQEGSARSDQNAPVVHTSTYASDGGYELMGLAGDDILIGSDGDDVINGGAGEDILVGGKGADVFVFDAHALDDLKVGDLIADYNSQEGDVLDISGLLDSLLGSSAGNDAREDAVSVTQESGNTIVSVDHDGQTHDLAILQNYGGAVKILFDDNHSVGIDPTNT
ncbi:VWA domain-containing protein (plasmid) [Peteryoungia desertarenae]|uniref:VWA domain-containing protein n=1 Tax=Peteryoungia desertarenae TaxID=1813451 RepID=A0ABX6QT14_9HYPH|nr:DUF5801 repeats-in-toxin domain-containing protein [Peteryoungia desertarenae]QLF71649.1 VWA domain-containing protein [Peteryoungia desertarenae]